MQTKNIFSLLVLFLSITITAQVSGISEHSDDGVNKNTKFRKLTNDIYYLQSDGGNIGIYFGKDEIFMVDSQTSTEINNNLKIIKRVSKNPIKYLVNTSFQPDHNGGNKVISKEGAIILSHKITKSKINELRRSDKKEIAAGLVSADLTFSENLTIHYRNEEIKIITTGKNSSELMVYFSKSNVLFTGDILYMKNRYPLLDIDNGISAEKTISGLDLILKMSNSATKIVPGHGDVVTINEVNASINMLTSLLKQIYSQRANGKTLDEVLASKSTITGRYDNKGYGDGEIKSDDIIRSIYNEAALEMGPLDKRTPQEKANDRLKEMQKAKGKN